MQVTDTSIDATFSANAYKSTISIPARLVRRGNELRIAIAPDGRSTRFDTIDQRLVCLVAQGFAARDYIVAGKSNAAILGYDAKHLSRLIGVSWLAPDIISAILEGRQPAQLTARHLLRCANIPLDWHQQRSFLGFN